jgi:hypothetical protein
MFLSLIGAATPTWGPVNIELDAILNDSYALGSGPLLLGAFSVTSFALKYGPRPVYIATHLATRYIYLVG